MGVETASVSPSSHPESDVSLQGGAGKYHVGRTADHTRDMSDGNCLHTSSGVGTNYTSVRRPDHKSDS